MRAGPRSSGGSVASGGGSHASRTGKTQCVPECIVHRNKPAVVVVDINANSDISASLASVVVTKAFALDAPLSTDDLFDPETRHGQAGLIQDPSLPTEDSTPPKAKKQKILDNVMYLGPPAIKPSASSANRVSVIPITARHNVLNGDVEGTHYSVRSFPTMMNPPGDSSTTKEQEFAGRGDNLSRDDSITINFRDAEDTEKAVSWKYGIDISKGNPFQKKTSPFTDPILSFEVVDQNFQFKLGQKIGIAVYRNYAFDFDNDDIWKNNNWDKQEFSKEQIIQLFGPDLAASIYTGQITGISDDGSAILHDINTYKGCSGAIIFLLDKNQGRLVDEKDYGKAIAIHGGGVDSETKVIAPSSGLQNGKTVSKRCNLGFTLKHLASWCKDIW